MTLPGRDQNPDGGRDEDADRPPVWEGVAEGGTPLAKGLEKIVAVDRDFSPQRFLEGARMAYDMIVTAFANGDRKALKSLLGSDVFEGFDRAIGERETRGDVIESTLVGIDKATMIEATLKAKIRERHREVHQSDHLRHQGQGRPCHRRRSQEGARGDGHLDIHARPHVA